MKSIVMVALLLLAMDADAATKRETVIAQLRAAGLTVDMTKDTGCDVLELPDRLAIYCHGEEQAAQYRRVMEALVEHNPVDKYNALINSGHVEVR